MNLFLWGVLPYISFTLLIGGLIWRYRSDQYGWTSRSSQLNEGRILRLSSPLFHFGILGVAAGHVMGLVIPQSWTEAMGVSEHAYHMVAIIGGGIAGLMTLVGLFGLLYRRIVKKSVRLATSRNDVFMYLLLTCAILLGAAATLTTQILGKPGGYNYRETIAVWFRSIFTLQPDVSLMTDVPLQFKLHIIAAFILLPHGLSPVWCTSFRLRLPIRRVLMLCTAHVDQRLLLLVPHEDGRRFEVVLQAPRLRVSQKMMLPIRVLDLC